MIQRIQSIWLLLAALTLICLLFLPIAGTETQTAQVSLHLSGIYQTVAGKQAVTNENFTPLLITNVVIAFICFFNIFNFRKRTSQKRVALISIVLIVLFAFWCSTFTEKLPGGFANAHLSVGAYFPIAAILFCILAIAGINKDEKLIRSADRLR